MNDSNLTTIINRWETERNKLSIKNQLDDLDLYNYYQTLDGLTGEAFFIQLQNIIEISQEVSYGEVRFILEKSDLKHSVYGSYLHSIYDGTKLLRYWDSNVTGVTETINREHVWPQSYLTDEAENSKKNIASDAHNIRAIFKTTNSSRSNRYFNDGSGPIGYTKDDWAYYPGDDHRGDVARILFYMHVKYSNDLFLTNSLTDILNYKDNKTKIDGRIPFGLLNVLLQWHIDDPVDEFEIQRNNIIYMYQGNRNPFIDHPEYVDIIFAVESTDGQINALAFMSVDYDLNINDLELNRKNKYFN